MVTRTDWVPRTNTDLSFASADAVPTPPGVQPWEDWNCWDQLARRYLGRRPEGA